MAGEKTSSSLWSVKNLKFKFSSFLQLEADYMPAWLVVIILIFLFAVLWLVCLHPLPAIVTGIGGFSKTVISKIRGS
jgi:hypothetical protein